MLTTWLTTTTALRMFVLFSLQTQSDGMPCEPLTGSKVTA